MSASTILHYRHRDPDSGIEWPESGTADIEIRALGLKVLEMTSAVVVRLAETPSQMDIRYAARGSCNTEITELSSNPSLQYRHFVL